MKKLNIFFVFFILSFMIIFLSIYKLRYDYKVEQNQNKKSTLNYDCKYDLLLSPKKNIGTLQLEKSDGFKICNIEFNQHIDNKISLNHSKFSMINNESEGLIFFSSIEEDYVFFIIKLEQENCYDIDILSLFDNHTVFLVQFVSKQQYESTKKLSDISVCAVLEDSLSMYIID